MKQYVVLVQMGNEEDYGWEEVERTFDAKEAAAYAKLGAIVYEEIINEAPVVNCEVAPFNNEDDLPF